MDVNTRGSHVNSSVEITNSGVSPLLLSQPSAAEVRAALDRIVSGGEFRGSARLKQLLRFVVEESLAGRGDGLKEYVIGTEVLGRDSSFDPRIDTIVRTEARKLRARLDEYYLGPGNADPVRIVLTKGRYAPSFFYGTPSALAPEALVTDAMLSAVHEERGGAPTAKSKWNRSGRVGILVALLLATGWGGYLLRRTPPAPPEVTDAQSVAVLPFADVDLNEERDKGVFGEGLAEELIDLLGQVPGLRVVARTSAFQFKDRNLDIREIGRTLRVANIVEGSVRRSGNRIRISVELAETRNGFRVWSRSYDRELEDALTVQREIAQAIAEALGGQLAAGSQQALAAGLVSRSGAYQNYLRGRHFLNMRTPSAIQTAIDHFNRAIAESPAFSLAHAGLAGAYAAVPHYSAAAGRDLIPLTRKASLQALSLDPSLGEAHMNLARSYMYNFEWKAADREFRKALELSPASATVAVAYAGYLRQTGRIEAGLEQMRKAFDSDPVSPDVAQLLAATLYWLHRYDEAIEQYKLALRLDPHYGFSHQGLGMAYVQKGLYESGIAELETARRLLENAPFPSGVLGYAYAVSGNKPAAMRILRELEEQSKTSAVPLVTFALVYAGLGDRDRTFDFLKRAIDDRDFNVRLHDPMWDTLRDDPRFTGLLRRMNLN